MEYQDHYLKLKAADPEIAGELAGIFNLERLLDWMHDRRINFGTLDMITQDEYSHDLIVPIDVNWLAFGMT